MWRAYRSSGRATAILLAVLVAASSCGGGEEPAADGDGEQAQEFGQSQESGDAQQADASPDLEQPDTDQAEPSEAEPALEPVQLGLRFAWCAEIQSRWNAMIEALAEAAAAEAAYDDAREAHEAATDELDTAEARVALDRAESALEERQSVLPRAASWAVPLIIPGTPPLGDNTTANIETHAIAVRRAREAFRDSADPATLELSELIHQVDWSAEDLTAEQEYEYYDQVRRGPPLVWTPPPSLAWEFYDSDVPDNAPGDFRATLAAIDSIRAATQEASSAAVPALEEMGRAITLAAAVESREDALAASRAWVEAMRSLSQVSAFSQRGLQDLVDEYHSRVRNDLKPFFPTVPISQEDHDEWVEAIDEAAEMVEFHDISPQLPSWVTTEFGELDPGDYVLGEYVQLAFWRGEGLLSDLRRVGEGFMLADIAGVEAFWASISESCEF